MKKPLLEIRNIEMQFPGLETPTLKNVDIQLEAGEISALIGPSGVGKSTLLHILARVLTPIKGDVYFEGENIFDYNENELSMYRSKHLGLLFQSFHVMSHLSVEDNVALGLLFENTHEKQKRVAEILEKVELSHKAKEYVKSLSGGQRQRVALARALVTNPKFILADEPTGNLDPKTGEHIVSLLRSLAKEGGAGVLFVTHEEPYLEFADTVFEVKDKTVVKV